MSKDKIVPQILHALPLRDIVIFPQMTTTILVGREKSVNSIKEAKKLNLPIFAVTQTNPDHDEFEQKNVYKIGVVCSIVEAIQTPDGALKVILQGVARAKIIEILPGDNLFSCEVDLLLEKKPASKNNKELLGLIKATLENVQKYSQYNKKITPENIAALTKIRSGHEIAYLIATFIEGSIDDMQAILQEENLSKKLYKILELLQSGIEIGQAEERINKSIQEKFTKHQKEIYLNEQLKNIKKELGEDDENDAQEFKNKIAKLKLPKEVQKKAEAEIKKLEKMNPYASESGVVRNYLDWICNIPWSKETKVKMDLEKARDILDKHHYGLEKVKDRIIEFMAVQIKTKNSKDAKGPILCLVGAPGVGKTSLAKSIAEALGRKYVKVSMGGVRDESEIRGHRRTYIGSMPGRIIQSMKRAEVINPLMLLDEVDKISRDFRGDPASALLEVLDPEQNTNFSDHYLEVEYDLSKVMFVATANSLDTIPIPLRDRMEIIKLSGYTENEKSHIALEHILPKQLKENGLKKSEFSISSSAILTLIRKYTFEAGVRNLTREIASLARKAATKIIKKEAKELHITDKNILKYAGPEKKDFSSAKEKDTIGVVTGLAYTEYGGDLLEIESLKFDGEGKVQITGQLGDVMKESAQAAFSYVRSIAKDLNIEAKKFNKFDFHIHVPEGATPKDGPSAGVALTVALASILQEKPIDKYIAMTGEVTLSGKVLKIGGLKEKLLAAVRGGIRKVLIPWANRVDLDELPKEVTKNLEIIAIKHVSEALKEAIVTARKKK